MFEIREIDTSVVYYIEQEMTNEWGSNVEVLDSYPQDLKNLMPPVVAVDCNTIRPNPLEIGTEDTHDYYYWHIHIFGRKTGERDDITNAVIDLLESGCAILDFSTGVAGDSKGFVNFQDINARPIRWGRTAPVGVRHHAVIVTKGDVTITD